MPPLLIGLAGRARSGKDTVAAHLIARHGYSRLAFADGVRDVAYATDPIVSTFNGGYDRLSHYVDTYGWEGAKELPEVRGLLQRLGTDGVRTVIGPFTWVDLWGRKFRQSTGPVVVTDVRFPNEAEMLRRLGGAIARVVRPGPVPTHEHTSESAMDDHQADTHLINDGSVADLLAKVDRWLATFPTDRTHP